MQCANLLRKRSLEPESWSCRTKRACLEAELKAAECPMETSHSLLVTKQQPSEVSVVRPRPQLCCPRCLAGEPGHINHILGL